MAGKKGDTPTPIFDFKYQGQAEEHPHRGAARLRGRRREEPQGLFSTPATRPSTRNLSGRARMSRTAKTWRARGAHLHPGEDSSAGHHRGLAGPGQQGSARGPGCPSSPTSTASGLRGPGRLLPPRAELVQPPDPGRLAPGDDLPGREGGPQGPGADDLPRPALRHQVRLQLAGLHPQARREGRQGRRRSPASPSRSRPSATPGNWASTPTWPTCGTAWSSPGNFSPRPAASSSRSAMKMCIWCGV